MEVALRCLVMCLLTFTEVGGVRTINFNEADLITCFANDYGYGNWVSKALEFYGDDGDLVILISSSGTSKNIGKCCKKCKEIKYERCNIFRF